MPHRVSLPDSRRGVMFPRVLNSEEVELGPSPALALVSFVPRKRESSSPSQALDAGGKGQLYARLCGSAARRKDLVRPVQESHRCISICSPW